MIVIVQTVYVLQYTSFHGRKNGWEQRSGWCLSQKEGGGRWCGCFGDFRILSVFHCPLISNSNFTVFLEVVPDTDVYCRTFSGTRHYYRYFLYFLWFFTYANSNIPYKANSELISLSLCWRLQNFTFWKLNFCIHIHSQFENSRLSTPYVKCLRFTEIDSFKLEKLEQGPHLLYFDSISKVSVMVASR
jgi:hypothetical protein